MFLWLFCCACLVPLQMASRIWRLVRLASAPPWPLLTTAVQIFSRRHINVAFSRAFCASAAAPAPPSDTVDMSSTVTEMREFAVARYQPKRSAFESRHFCSNSDALWRLCKRASCSSFCRFESARGNFGCSSTLGRQKRFAAQGSVLGVPRGPALIVRFCDAFVTSISGS